MFNQSIEPKQSPLIVDRSTDSSFNSTGLAVCNSYGCNDGRELQTLTYQQFKDLRQLTESLSSVLDEDVIKVLHQARQGHLLPFFSDPTIKGGPFEAHVKQWAEQNGLLDNSVPITAEMISKIPEFKWEGSKHNAFYEAYYQRKRDEAEAALTRLEDQMELHKGVHELSALANRDLCGDEQAYTIAIKREDDLPISLKEKLLYEPLEVLTKLLKGLRWDEGTIFSHDVGDDLLIKKRLRSLAEATYTIR
jgi:hypothetical protein